MAVQEVPKSYRYTCDNCRAEHNSGPATGHYTDSRPMGWVRLKIIMGYPSVIELLLCPKCGDRTVTAIGRRITLPEGVL